MSKVKQRRQNFRKISSPLFRNILRFGKYSNLNFINKNFHIKNTLFDFVINSSIFITVKVQWGYNEYMGNN